MPLYEYKCSSCNEVFEYLSLVHDDLPTECPKCHCKDFVRVPSVGGGFIFIGEGFYETTYKKKSIERVEDNES